jgi:hypothetical protein
MRFFTSKMAIDADGSARAYNRQNTGLDDLNSAGWTGGIVKDNNGKPCIQGPHDPYPRYFVSGTTLNDGCKQVCDYSKYVDSEKIPYIVLPEGWYPGWDIKVGDFSTVINLRNMKMSHAIFADTGPRNKIGEGSIALAQALGIDSNPRSGGTVGKLYILYIVFPGTGAGSETLRSLEEINQNGERLFEEWGGKCQVYAIL